MPKSLLLLSLACLLPCLGGLAAPAPAPAMPPLKVVGSNYVDIGRIPDYLVVPTTFRIRNPGDRPVAITRIIPTCSCIKGSTDTNAIPPQGEAVLTVNLDARLVHGTFRRGLWLETDHPTEPRLIFAVLGEVIPLFEGLPTTPVALDGERVGVAWTNRYTLTATRAGARLGAPVLQHTDDLLASLSFTTNAAEKMSYDLTVVVQARAFGKHKATVTLPVEGVRHAEPLKLEFMMRSGSELTVSPSHVLLTAEAGPLTRRLLLRADVPKTDTALLTWEPTREGVAVTVKPAVGAQSMMVTLEITPAAAAALLKEPRATLRFNYPNHKPAVLTLGSTARPAPAGEPLTQRPRIRGIGFR